MKEDEGGCGSLEDYSDYSSIRRALVDHLDLDHLDHIPSSLPSSSSSSSFFFTPKRCVPFSCILLLPAFAFALIHESRVQSALQLRRHGVDDAPPRFKPNCLLAHCAATAAAAEFLFSLAPTHTHFQQPSFARNNKSNSPRSFLLLLLLLRL